MNRCAECPREFLPINGSGPRQSRLLWIGERPGRRENDRGRVFIGPTGEEYDNTYLPAAGMRRPEQRVENCTRCWALGNRTPTEKEALSCARHFLPDVLRECQPEVVVLMGGSAHRIVDVHPDEKRPRVDMIHGRPFYGSLLGGIWEGWIWSSYHPALGMHATEKMWDLLTDFKNLRQWLEGDWVPPSPAEGIVKDYRLGSTAAEVSSYFKDFLK